MASLPQNKIEDCQDYPPVQAVIHFIEKHGRHIDEVRSWSVILPNEGEFTVDFADFTGYMGVVRNAGAFGWYVYSYRGRVTAVSEKGIAITTVYATTVYAKGVV